MRYVCELCGYVYDEAEGLGELGYAPGTKFDDLPDDWVCPLCGASKDEFHIPRQAGEKQSAGLLTGALTVYWRLFSLSRCRVWRARR